MTHACKFLKYDYPEIEELCFKLEKSIIHEFYLSSIMLGRIIGEKIAISLSKQHYINITNKNQKERIEILKRASIIGESYSNIEEKIFNLLQDIGNYAAHGNIEQLTENSDYEIKDYSLMIHKSIYYLSSWFYKKTINPNFKIKDYPGILLIKEYKNESFEDLNIELNVLETKLKEAKKKKQCEFCGAEIKEGANFCNQCGNIIDESKVIKFCIQCGSPVEQGANFCSECGYEYKNNEIKYFNDFLNQNPFKNEDEFINQNQFKKEKRDAYKKIYKKIRNKSIDKINDIFN